MLHLSRFIFNMLGLLLLGRTVFLEEESLIAHTKTSPPSPFHYKSIDLWTRQVFHLASEWILLLHLS